MFPKRSNVDRLPDGTKTVMESTAEHPEREKAFKVGAQFSASRELKTAIAPGPGRFTMRCFRIPTPM
ncbi:MAG: hypothetical protein KGY39_00295 [Anaerolineales bacterium]|nr:hypothetical protein [Anaerolineales bacterium]MBS3752722.1 hypothetical protein [Anaerolineales bacterium]